MIALDTNILARYLLGDEPAQAKAAATLLAEEKDFTVPPTVMLELVWVLPRRHCQGGAFAAGIAQLQAQEF